MAMTENDFEFRAAEGTADAVLCLPEGEGQWPGVLYLTDIGGIRATTREQIRRLAAEGYAVLMPNLFYRTARPPVFDVKPGDVEARRKRMSELTAPLTPEELDRDLSIYVDTLTGDRFCAPGDIGVVGYCFSGGVAMRTAALRADRVAAVASFHGGRLYTDSPASPHLLLPRIKAQLYFAHAVEDGSMPKEAIGNLNRALAEWGGSYRSDIYPGAFHSWTMPDSPVYNQPQAERAFGELLKLFREKLQR
jgi:carboxymethylenebutenolidase